jgi:hypothetical protein
MAQRGGEMPLFDIRVEFFHLAALMRRGNSGNAAASLRAGPGSPFLPRKTGNCVTGADHPTFGTEEEIADDVLLPARPVRDWSSNDALRKPSSCFHRDLYVATMLLGVSWSSSNMKWRRCNWFVWQSDAESPARHVELMDVP